MRRRNRQPGFTLLELMTTVAILGVLTALSVGGLEPLVARLRARQAVAEVYGAAVRAQALARASGRCARLEVVGSAPGVPLSEAPVAAAGDALRLMRWSSADCEGSEAATAVEALALPAGARVRFAAGPPELVFRPNGRPRGGASLLEVARGPDLEVEGNVRVAINGPVCLFTGPTPGACP